ncbi:DNA mismatch repair protein MutS [Alicyclobacillus sp. ALC3]|uniref:DNA mismatch repair protein MutS n=1 Tax=Alicyclobacillus sp. ALC3 TaxID=2796143 RepID=UPI002379D919|nr:DNA mismatch repair protein MutS [Alicyclobacillus sp. ALC3]WDL97304.1 DNA mismatch repair protein MutS [Alicyclobacillus sp. ALC3]
MSHTPMMQQYLDIKANYQHELLMFRLGDFYELFFDDALTASRVLEITLTGRDAGSAGRIPMCGVPFHAVEQYIARLIDHGYSVALCDQTEDPKQTKGLVKREVVRVVTPGTATYDEGALLRWLAAVVRADKAYGLAMIDVGTGAVWTAETDRMEVIREQLLQRPPAEILVYESASEDDAFRWLEPWRKTLDICALTMRKPHRHSLEWAAETVRSQYGVASLTPLDLGLRPAATEALALALEFVQETQRLSMAHLRSPQNLLQEDCMVLDYAALRNLEVFETSRSRQRKGSLFDLLDNTKTAMGARTLRQWLERPLGRNSAIEERLDAVEAFVEDVFLRDHVQKSLGSVYDLDRLSGKVALGTANGRDLLAIARSLAALPLFAGPLSESDSVVLQEAAQALPDCAELTERLLTTLVDEPPVSVRDGGIIRTGVDSLLDKLKGANQEGKTWLAALEQRERERTGIKALKVGYNKVFGYYIEVSKANQHLVPTEYERRQTLSTGERYVVPELKEREAQILHAEEQAVLREYELFVALRDQVMARLADLQQASRHLGVIDALCALGEVAAVQQYRRPRISDERGLVIEQGRHPVVEAALPGQFVANDVRLGSDQAFILLTGPNMAGKSTYMRQVALIVLLAHIGSFVPAAAAEIGVVDRIFTRIGASDDLGAGQSTFMVEMVELAQILRQATDRSLVLLDEIGRGTSTYDGLCIAEAVMEALQQEGQRPLTLFATHYHELVETAEQLPSVVNYSVAVRESGSDITFLHTVVPRPADKSYGIQVAKLAGIPAPVLARATELLVLREAQHMHSTYMATAAASEGTDGPGLGVNAQPVSLFASAAETELVTALAELDVDNLTPREAMRVLFALTDRAKEALSWATSK